MGGEHLVNGEPLTWESASRCSSAGRTLPVRSSQLCTTHPGGSRSKPDQRRETRSEMKANSRRTSDRHSRTFSTSPFLKLSSSAAVALKSYFPRASIRTAERSGATSVSAGRSRRTWLKSNLLTSAGSSTRTNLKIHQFLSS